ncbi:hypothetical protein TGRH88_082220 [Toxoplasma gondii]|uniref:Uncharacterized protein n=1 Tax=Toxoplasma gondii TaxID=5811 RepID=A0A7J6K5S3_TOXGO|nr:hypothetical protein TGRH88_082220 [Toxoplasma gondii]
MSFLRYPAQNTTTHPSPTIAKCRDFAPQSKQSTRTEKRRHLDVSKELSDPFRGLPRHRPPAASLTTASAHSDVLHAKTNAFGPTSEGNGPCARSPAIGATTADFSVGTTKSSDWKESKRDSSLSRTYSDREVAFRGLLVEKVVEHIRVDIVVFEEVLDLGKLNDLPPRGAFGWPGLARGPLA